MPGKVALVPQFIPAPKPDADLEAIDPEPVETYDGGTRQKFKTRFGKVFIRVVESSGEVRWLKQTD